MRAELLSDEMAVSSPSSDPIYASLLKLPTFINISESKSDERKKMLPLFWFSTKSRPITEAAQHAKGKERGEASWEGDRQCISMPSSHSDEVHFSLSVQGWTLCIFMVNLFTEPLLKFWKQRKCICSITFPDLTSPIKSIKAFNEIPAQSQLP